MPNDGVTIEPLVETLTTPPPAQGADDKKPDPATAADDKKTDTPAATDETAKTEAEQKAEQEQKQLSRRERKVQRERDLRIAAETRAQIAEERLAKAESAKTPAQDREPTREDYPDKTYEEFLDIRQDWRADQREKKREESSRKEREDAKAREVPAEVAKSWGEKEVKFMEKTPGYDKAVNPYVKSELGDLSDGARQLMIESDVGPALLHHMATNEEDHDRIAALSPARQVIEIGKIEDRLSKVVEAKTTSSAPAPAKPSPQGKGSPSKDPEKMSQDEYMAWRKQGGARWAR